MGEACLAPTYDALNGEVVYGHRNWGEGVLVREILRSRGSLRMTCDMKKPSFWEKLDSTRREGLLGKHET